MVVNRRIWSLIFVILFSFSSSAQAVRKSFDFKEEKRSKILQEAVEGYGFYLSYKPNIFVDDPVLTLFFEDQPLGEVMRTILGDSYTYRKIEDYIVIVPVPDSSSKTTQHKIIYDTITVEKEVIRYDTQRVVLTEVIHDTVTVRETIYDTVRIDEKRMGSEKEWTHGPYITPFFQQFGSGSERSLYSGGAIGWTIRRRISNMQLQLSTEYAYLQNRMSFSESFMEQEQQIDTIAQFFVIEGGVSIPVYLTDTTLVDRTIERFFDRTNTRNLINFTIDFGHDFEWEKITLGTYLGIITGITIRSDELRKSGDNQDIEISNVLLNSPSFSLQLQLPLYFQGSDARSKAYLAPLLSVSIHDVTDRDAISMRKISYGVRLGWLF